MKHQSLKPLKNQRGFSLIEILIAFGLMGFLALVMSSLFSDMYKAQKQTNVVNTLESMRLNIIKLTNDSGPWRNTVDHPANAAIFNCIINQTQCTHTAGAESIPSDENSSNAVLDAAPFIQLNRLQGGSDNTNASTYINNMQPTRGFTESGEPCNSFQINPANGTDACPIRWSIRFAFECPSAPNCINPVIRVIGILYYHPNPNNKMKAVINPIKYRVDLKRGAQGDVRSELIHVEYRRGGGAAQDFRPAFNGGRCDPGGTDIPFNTVASDNAGNLAGAPSTVIPLKAGTYSCSASSSCFACESVKIEILAQGNATPLGSSIKIAAPKWVQAQVQTSQVVFTLNAQTNIMVRQYCSAVPGMGDTFSPAPTGSPINLGLGMALPPYTTTKFAEIICTRMF